MKKHVQRSVALTPEAFATAKRLGGGNVSAGIRYALTVADGQRSEVARLQADIHKSHKKIMEILAHLLMTRLDVATSDGASESARRWAAQHGEAVKAGAKSILAGDSE